MSAFDDYLQLLNNNPKMDATKQFGSRAINNLNSAGEGYSQWQKIQDQNFGPNQSVIASSFLHPQKGLSKLADWFTNNVNTATGLTDPNQQDEASMYAYGPSVDQKAESALNLAGLLQGSAFASGAAPKSAGGTLGSILAWHASPHKFSKFENKAIGTGEGVQAFGMGHYSGENANALDYQYRKQLLHRTAQNPLEQFIADPNHQTALDKLRSHVDNAVIASYPGYSGFTDAQKKFVKLKNYNDTLKFTFNNAQLAKNYPKNTWSGLTDMNREVYDMSKAYTAPTIISPNKGYLYQLNLKPDKKDLLQYDTAISRHGTDFLDKYVAGMNDLGLGQDAFTAIKSNLKGKDAYRNLTKVTGSDTETSRLLNDWGIPGHSFAGQGGKGLDNYVMYNPDDMQIIRRIKAGLDSPIESFRNYPVDVHRAVNNLKLNPADARPKGLLQKIQELSNKNLRELEW
jgi:hypothetical protein